MDDQVFDELMAEADLGVAVATAPEIESPVETPETLGLQETQSPDDAQTDSNAEEDVSQETAETVTVPDEPVAGIEERAQAIAAQLVEQQNAERKAMVEAKLLEYAYQQDAEGSQKFEADLEQYDSGLAGKYREHRAFVVAERDRYFGEAQRMEHGIKAWTLAVEQRFPDVMPDLIGEATALMGLPNEQAMIQFLTSRDQAKASESAKVQELERQNRDLRLRLEAKARPLEADIVDGGQTGPGGLSFQQRWDNATDMDDVMEILSTS